MRSLLDRILECKFKFNRIFLDGMSIFRRVARIPFSGEISEISVEKKKPTDTATGTRDMAVMVAFAKYMKILNMLLALPPN
jgi:hypothetical protein